ncbi:MAG: AmmeMemoRadiSam system radical SAM enzyme, partial [Fervidobacterium nodosum]
AKKYLNYVYLGNVWDEKYESTYCPKCGNIVIIRKGYNIEIVNLDEEGRCKVCSNQILRNL